MSDNVCIRKVDMDELLQVANVHVESWRSTYSGIVHDEFLNQLSPASSEERFRRILSHPQNQVFMFVAEVDGQIVGHVIGGPHRNQSEGFVGELYAIYLLASRQGRGIGRRLFQAVVHELRRQDMNSMLLWVLVDNTPARKFYESMGGQLIGESEITLGNQKLKEVSYGWRDLREVVRHGEENRAFL